MNSIAIVHPMSLLGKEVRERLEQRPDLCREVRLLASDEQEVGTLTESGGSATFVHRADAEGLAGVDLAIFCGDIAADRLALAQLPPTIRAVVASHGAGVEDGLPAVAGLAGDPWLGHDRLVAPSSTALAAAELLAPLADHGLAAAAVTALLPVAERNQAGLDALFEETRSVLNFAGPGRSGLFAAQIAFNLLPDRTAGELAESQLASLLGQPPRVSVQAVRGGVFHAVALSLLLRFDHAPAIAELRQSLTRHPGLRFAKDAAKLGPVAAAGEERILLGELRAAPDGLWLWAALDQLVLGAQNVLRLAEGMLRGGRAS